MRVADLRQLLAGLAKMLESAEASKVAKDLASISDGLAPFDGMPLKDFAAFLVKAEAYSRGELPITSSKKGGGKARGSGKMAGVDLDAISREVRDLYNSAANSIVTADAIDAVIRRLSGLKKDDLIAVARTIELKLPKSKSLGEMIAAIGNRIIARKGSSQRAGLLDRPTPTNANVEAPDEASGHRVVEQE